MAKLKVYLGDTFVNGRQHNALIATTSLKEVARLARTTLYDVREYWAEGGNDADIAAALAAPGVLLVNRNGTTSPDDWMPAASLLPVPN